MRLKIRTCAAWASAVAVAVAAAVVTWPAPARAAATPAIMIVGDSISQGSSGDYTWRYRLAKHLSGNGWTVNFVGTRTDLFDRAANTHGSQQYVDGNFDRDHAAKWGEMIGIAKDRIAADVTASGAQILLVHLGINDLVWGGTAAGAESALREFIANARSANPNLRMIFGKVLPNETARDNPAIGTKVTDYNARLASVVAALSTAASPLHVVDQPAGYDPTADTYDGTHLNPRGEYRLAAAYADGLSRFTGIGPAFGAIPSVPLFGAPAGLTATPSSNAVALQWSGVAGATGYYVWQRDVTAGQDWVQLPYPLSTTSWDAMLLTNGHTWQFRIQALRGHDAGGFSPTATAVPNGPPPSAPTGLSAAPLDGEALLSWTGVDGATGYYISMRDVTAAAAWNDLPYPVEDTQWTAGLLVNGRTYEFRVRAASFNGYSAWSNVASVVPRGPRPDAPDDLRATPGNGEALLSWTPATGATGYMVWMRDTTVGEAWRQLPYPVTGAGWTAGLLANGHRYEFKLRAVSGSGESGDSNVAAVTPTAPVPGVPTNLAAVAGDGLARLSWTRSTGATGYFVHIRDVTAGEGVFRKLPYPVAGPTWTAELLANQHVYEFKLTATGPGGESGFSNTVRVTPVGPKPPVPTNLTATSGDRQARLCWRASAGATGYLIGVRDATAGEAWRQLPYPVTGTCWTAELLINQHAYDFRVYAVNVNGSSGASDPVRVTPVGPPPAAPTGLTATPGEGQAVLRWTASAGATGYIVYVRDVTAGEGFRRLPYPVTGTSWTAQMLANGHRYEFKLRAGNANGESGFSNIASATPVIVAPAATTWFLARADAGAPGEIQFYWRAVPNVTNYIILARSSYTSEVWTAIAIVSPNQTSHHMTVYDVDHRFKVVSTRYGVHGGERAYHETVHPVRDRFADWDSVIPSYQGFPKGQCTWYAALKAWEYTGHSPTLIGGWGHAYSWDGAATDDNLGRYSTPERYDIAQWDQEEYIDISEGRRASSETGHVAWVEQVYHDGNNDLRMIISQYSGSTGRWSANDIKVSDTRGEFIRYR